MTRSARTAASSASAAAAEPNYHGWAPLDHWPHPQPAQTSRLLCASWISATLVDLKGYMQRPVDAQLFV